MVLANDHRHDLGERLDAVALKLRLDLDQSETGEASEAVGRLRYAIADAFDVADNALRDKAVRADVHEAGRIFVDALATTVAALSGGVREKVGRRS